MMRQESKKKPRDKTVARRQEKFLGHLSKGGGQVVCAALDGEHLRKLDSYMDKRDIKSRAAAIRKLIEDA